MKFLKVSRRKKPETFSLQELCCIEGEFLSKFRNCKKTALHWKVPSYAPVGYVVFL